MLRLCFGTFAKVLKHCKLRAVTDVQLVGTLTKILDPTCEYSESDGTAISRLLSCEQNLSNGQMRRTGQRARTDHSDFTAGFGSNRLSNVVLAAQKAIKANVVLRIATDILPLLDEDRKPLAVLALLGIIAEDTVIDIEKQRSFEKYLGKTKSALLSQDEFVISEIFAGILLYTVIAVQNTEGKSTAPVIDKAYIDKFAEKDNIFNFATAFPDVSTAVSTDSVLDNTPIDETAVKDYLNKVHVKYNEIKTLLYCDQPKPFYSFYVCNNIERRIPKQSRFSSSYEIVNIVNATSDALAECSKFIILSGTGGLGKSMMMRHLLLDSISKFEKNGVLPVFVALKDFNEATETLFNYVYSKLSGFDINISSKQFDALLSEGKCLLLFDGLDEIGTKFGAHFEKELEAFTDRYPANNYVISSRPYRSFVSYSRFTVFYLKPFSKEQALELVDKLEFRPDEPAIKNKFKSELSGTLHLSHREFTENPLLLTIMLMTFEQFAEVPSKMHIFYREAFVVLSQKHDASKGAYKRTLKTGLTTDKFADYFAEFCSRSYHDEKFELSEMEFGEYYESLKERKKEDDSTTTAEEFLYDLCLNMCLMFLESGKYHFTHRSFQEYFCALYFSKQKDKNLRAIGNFFEKRRSRNFGDKTFIMLYDMIPAKIEEYVFLPFLADLFKECDERDGYLTFLEIMYPRLSYEYGVAEDLVYNSPASYLYEFIKKEHFANDCTFERLPFYEPLVIESYGYIEEEDGERTLVNLDDVDNDYEYGKPDEEGWLLEFDVEEIRKKERTYKELLIILTADGFVLKEEYDKAREYFTELEAKQKPTGDSLFDLFN